MRGGHWFADARTTAREKGQQPMSAYGLGLGLGMTSIAAAVARGSAVDVVPAGGDAASMAAPALAYATHGGRIATGADARRRAIGSPDRLVSRVLHDVASSSSVSAGDSADAGLATRSRGRRSGARPARHGAGRDHRRRRGPGWRPRPADGHPPDTVVGRSGRRARRRRPAGRTRSGALQLIPSAVAVAVNYTVDHPLADGEAVGVVDVGATCFEAAVVGRRGTELAPLSPRVAHGATGGDQFDDAVLQLVDRAAGGAVTALKRGDDPAGPDRPGSAAPRLPPREGGPLHRQRRDHHRLPAHGHGQGRSHPHRVRRR